MVGKTAILLSTYNGERYLRDLLDSLVQQSVQDFDLFVRDDGSRDSTLPLLASYRDRLNLIILPSDGNIGPAKSFMRLLEHAGEKYDFYMFSDQDDWWKREKIGRASSVASERDASVPFLYCSALDIVDSELRLVARSSPELIPSKMNSLVENIATGCTIGINAAARRLLLSRLPARYAMHDWWIYIVISFFGDIFFDRQATIKYRQHGSNVVGGAVGRWSDFLRRLRRFFVRRNAGVFLISDQTREFLRCFGDRLTDKDAKNVKRLSDKRWRNNIWLAFFSPFFRQSLIDNLILRFLFLIGRY